MSISIVINKQNVTKSSKKVNVALHESEKHISFKKYAKKVPIIRAGKDIIFVGLGSKDATKPNAVIYSFTTKEDHYAYILDISSRPEINAVIPKGAKNVSSFAGTLKILDDKGIVDIIKGNKIYIYSKDDEIYIRIGETESAKMKALKRQCLLEQGVWRAE